MIPATIAYMAVFKSKLDGGTEFLHRRPVIAWDEDGYALVADEANGRLRQAAGYGGAFVQLLEGGDERFVALAPGGGWLVERTGPGGTSTVPVVAWGVDGNGVVYALDTDGDGEVDKVAGEYRIFHPSESHTS